MLTGGDQVGDSSTRITAGDQPFADQDGIGTGTGVGQQIGSATNTGFGDSDHVGRQPRGDARKAVPVDP